MTQRRAAITIGLSITSLLVFGLASWLDRAQPRLEERADTDPTSLAARSSSLRIEDVLITDPLNDRSEVEAQATAAWIGVGFPGVRSCTFVARDGSGLEVGRFEDVVASLSPSAGFSFRVEASARATSMEATCGERLDVGTPYRYDITNVRVTGDETAEVRFDASWAAPGQAGAVACQLDVLDQAGGVVESDQFTLFILTGSRSDLDRSLIVEGTPTSAEFRCTPFVG